MAKYMNMAPVTLTFSVTFDGVTPGGKCRAVDGSVVLHNAVGPNAEVFNVVVSNWGDILPLDMRLVKGKPKSKTAAAPAPAPAPAPVAKGKPKGKPAAKPEVEAPSEMELMLERMLEKKLKEMLGK